MSWAKQALHAVLGSALLASLGCCYHAQHFGKRRDIGIGAVGCGACQRDSSPCEQGDCSQGSCTPSCTPGCTPGSTPGMLPLKTSGLVRGNSIVSVSYQDPARSMMSRLRDRIDARKVEHVELVVPQLAPGEILVATPEPPVATANVIQPASNVVPAGQTPVVTTASSPSAPALAPAPITPPPVDVPIRDAKK